jgi:hypothetical protein
MKGTNMPNDSTNIGVGKPKPEGAAFCAPDGTALPTDASTGLPAEWACIGYAADAGLSNKISTSNQDIKAWGGVTVRTVQTDYGETYSIKLIECMNPTTLAEVFGKDSVEVSESGTIKVAHTATEKNYHPWCFDLIISDDVLQRVVIPQGKVTEVGDIVYSDSEAIGFDVTISCRPDKDGATSYCYIDKVNG